MDPFTVIRWLGVCAEPPIEEAQPAWWLELQRSEELQNKTEGTRSVTQQAALPSTVSSTVAPGAEGRKVRFASVPPEEFHSFYEDDAEFIISPAHAGKKTSPMQPSEQNETGSWDLSDLDDVADIRRMLIPVHPSPSSSAGSFATSSHVDFRRDRHPPGAEPVFQECGRSVDSTSSGV
ncbi:hypothetical protein, conserved [Eimeria praecox]|uniref:Uncharacterized protein n=1 Tax=Eimeria praecox TaxID=51316 RepID=U6G7A0_9EIME|nr:hypothetical protein, conserved [Eimeria praecox]